MGLDELARQQRAREETTRALIKQVSMASFMAGFYHGAEHMNPSIIKWPDGQVDLFEATGMEIFNRQYESIMKTVQEGLKR